MQHYVWSPHIFRVDTDVFDLKMFFVPDKIVVGPRLYQTYIKQIMQLGFAYVIPSNDDNFDTGGEDSQLTEPDLDVVCAAVQGRSISCSALCR